MPEKDIIVIGASAGGIEAEIAPLLVRLTGTPVEEEGAVQVPEEMEIEVRIAKEEKAIDAGVQQLGEPSSYACPECHGVLLQLKEGGYLRFRCHTGHAYSVESLLSEVTEKIEDALWNAIRTLEENVLLMRHLARHVREGNNGGDAEQFLKRAREAERRADLVRQAAMDYELTGENRLGEGINEG